MASDYNLAGIRTGHNTYVLLEVVQDLIKGFHTDAHERRFITASRVDLEAAIGGLQDMVAAINRGDTAQTIAQRGPAYVPHQGYRE